MPDTALLVVNEAPLIIDTAEQQSPSWKAWFLYDVCQLELLTGLGHRELRFSCQLGKCFSANAGEITSRMNDPEIFVGAERLPYA